MAKGDLQKVIDHVRDNGPMRYADLKAQFPALVTGENMRILRRALTFYFEGREHMVKAGGE